MPVQKAYLVHDSDPKVKMNMYNIDLLIEPTLVVLDATTP